MIEIQNLTFTYQHHDTPALKQVNFDIEQGEVVGVIGHNGAGKSTLCYALMGLIPHFYPGMYDGAVTVSGRQVDNASIAELSKEVGFVFQNPLHQFSGAKLTVADEISFGLENHGVNRIDMMERVNWASEMLGVSHLLHRNPYELSGGQMQRVAIASVFAMKPRLLVLDEPTSQLDPVGTNEVFQALGSLQNVGITVVIVEHKVERLAEHCDRIAVMCNGQLKCIGTPTTVFGNPKINGWGAAAPVYTQAYQRIDPNDETVPTTLEHTVARLVKRANTD